MFKSPDEYLRHILIEAGYLMSESANLTLADLVQDETRMRAFVRSLEIIGGAAKNMPEEFRESNPKVDWKAMAGMRDKLIHGYFGIDYEIFWDVIVNEIPRLKEQLEILLRS